MSFHALSPTFIVLIFGLIIFRVSAHESNHVAKNGSISVHMTVHVALLGFNDDDIPNVKSIEQHLQRGIAAKYRPKYLDNGQLSNFIYNIQYFVSKLPQTLLDEFVLLRNEAIELASRRQQHAIAVYGDAAIIDATELSHYFETAHNLINRQETRNVIKNNHYTIFILNPPPHTQTYSYAASSNSMIGSNIWIGSGRWIVADIQALPAEVNEGDQSMKFLLNNPTPAVFQQEISRLCYDAVKSVFVSQMSDHKLRPATKFIIPIIVFQNHNLWDPWGKDNNKMYKGAYIDIDEIEREISKMFLPLQTYEIATATHGLHEHKQISIALYNSLRVRSVTEKEKGKVISFQREYFLDSKLLRQELRNVRDVLASFQQIKDVPNVRVIPVYVFSLAGVEERLFLENYQLVTSDQDSVIVLQTNETKVPVPYTMNDKLVYVNAMENTERYILAGIAKSLGAISSPVDFITNKKDFKFVAGFHPFGYFSESNVISPALTDAIIRNQMIINVDQYIFKKAHITASIERFLRRHLGNAYDRSVKVPDLISFADIIEKHFSHRMNFVLFAEEIREEAVLINKHINELVHAIEEGRVEDAYTQASKFASNVVQVEQNFINKIRLLDIELYCVYLHRNLGHASIFTVLISITIMFFLAFTLLIQCLPPKKKKVTSKDIDDDAYVINDTSFSSESHSTLQRRVDRSGTSRPSDYWI